MSKDNDNILCGANIIQKGTSIVGNINTEGNIRVDGEVKGDLKVQGKLIVGNTGFVDGNIDCGNALIEGLIKGKILVKDLLEMKANSRFEGEITTSKLSIETGSYFSGNCKMTLKDSLGNKDKK